MNEPLPTARTTGVMIFRDENIYQDDIDPVEIRRRIGMLFQKPNPFTKSSYVNVVWGAGINGYKGDDQPGEIIEYDDTELIFARPKDKRMKVT